jgi:DNA repair photolyase
MVMAKRFGWVKNYTDWRKPKIVSNALELLDREIPKYKDKIKFVHLSFMTDPFMYKNREVRKLTLKIIEKLNKNGIRCTVLTKGILPKSLKNIEKYGSKNEYGITLVSLNSDFKKKFEPYSSPYSKRIESLKYLHDKGLVTWVSMEPYPTPNLVKQNFLKILNKISFANKIIFGKLNYNVKSSNFEDNTLFYENCARKLLSFSRTHDINYHIKFGTVRNYDTKTKNIFHLQTAKVGKTIKLLKPILNSWQNSEKL